MKNKILNLVSILIISLPVYAATPEEVMTAFKKGDDAEGFKLTQQCISNGHTRCHLFMGYLYAEGRGVEKNMPMAMEWFLKAAQLGDSQAQYQVAVRYEYEMGVEKNSELYMRWLKESAANGLADAEFRLGLEFKEGRYLDRDFIQAFKWVLKAAEQGHQKAMHTVASYYHEGIGVEKDMSKFFEWTEKLAKSGHAEAQYVLGLNYRDDGNGDEAVHWFKLSAEQGHIKAQYNLGQLYGLGMVGIKENPEEAAKWWSKAAHQGHMRAQYNYGRYLGRNGDRFNGDMWVYLSAEAGNDNAKNLFSKLEAAYDENTIVDIKARAEICMSSSYQSCNQNR